MHGPTPGRRSLRVCAAAVAVALTLLLGACSEDADEPSQQTSDSPVPRARDHSDVRTTAALGRVTGDLDRQRRQPLQRAVSATVDQWLDAAYVGGDYPRDRFGDAFAVFTAPARAEARSDQQLTSNAEVGSRLDDVRARRSEVSIDVLARGGHPLGVTARVTLAMRLTGEVTRTDRVSGSVYLTRTGQGWRIFGYDLERGTLR